jgi:ankyrin repeat protein
MAALEFVIFSKRPPTLPEVAEAAAVGSLDGPFESREENQVFEPEEILRICPSLLVLEEPVFNNAALNNASASENDSSSRFASVSNPSQSEEPILNKSRVRPAHYSVSEYFLSPRIWTGPANAFAMSEDTGEIYMARMCLRYLMLFNDSKPLNRDVYKDFPLSRYAARWWHQHITPAVFQHDPATVELLRTVLETETHYYFLNSVRLSDPECYNKPDLELQPDDLLSPLYYLCVSNVCSEVVKFAVDLGFDVNGQGGRYGSPLQAATRVSREVNTLDILLKAGADVNALSGIYGTALNVTVAFNFEEGFARLLEAGADPCRRENDSGNAALHIAAYLGNYATRSEHFIHMLLDAGADINAIDELEGTPLTVAVERRNIAMIRTLLQAGADVNTQGPYSIAALVKAAYWGDVEVLLCLLNAGADLNVVENYDGMTALGAAAGAGHMEIVRTLLQAGADVNVVSRRLKGALAEAARTGNIAILNCLLDAGADVNLRGERCATALEAASTEGHIEVVRRLIEAGADAKASSRWSETSLIEAAMRGMIDVVDCLLEAGADPDVGGRNYKSAFEAALDVRNYEIYERLIVGAKRGKGMKRSASSERTEVR